MKIKKIQRKKSSSNDVNKGKKDKEMSNDDDNEIEDDEITVLRRRAIDEAPESGTQVASDGKRFDEMPLSTLTLQGLKIENFTVATDIQAAAIPHALAGRDILGAAKTGSGKTLAFVIPLIERLYTERWGLEDGLGAIVLTPTRELALQIFDVIRIAGKKHQLSAGLVTGGRKEFEEEQRRVVKMNILVATPGRLLQHFEETPGFDASQLVMLVLDEADRILDLGFKQQLDGIMQYLNPHQTLLFSATQTKSVKDLARLSLNNPEYLSVHQEEEDITPKQLTQHYIICNLQDKLDILFSFIRMHLKSKMIVFFSTCSQVRFVHECFRGMQPGVPLTALHGKIKQDKRTLIYMDFLKKKAACMFATDIAARGLDFPDVDWVIQVDAPDDSAMYIHRVGRTARYTAEGRALLMIMPNEEEAVVKGLKTIGVPIKKLSVNNKRTFSVSSKAAALLVAQPECRALAKKAFVGYLRSLQLLPSERAIYPGHLPVDAFAQSLGLAFTPTIPMVPTGAAGRDTIRESKNVNQKLDKLKKQIKEAKEKKKMEKMEKMESQPQTNDSAKIKTKQNKSNDDDDDDDDEEFFTVKETNTTNTNDDDYDNIDSITNNKKRKKLKIRADGDGSLANKISFDDEGNATRHIKLNESNATGVIDKEQIEEHTRRVKARLEKSRDEDVARDRARVKEMHRERRLRDKPEKGDSNGNGYAVLGGSDSDNNNNSDNDDNDENDDNDNDNDYDEDAIKSNEERILQMMNL